MRLHTHVALVNNAVLLASEVVFILLMAGGIYIRNPGPRAFKIMYREVGIIVPMSSQVTEQSRVS